MFAILSYFIFYYGFIIHILMEIAIGLEGENICRNLNTNLSRCCKDYEEKLNRCVECRSGYFGLNCSSKCPENYYGLRCGEICDCPERHYCNHICGCKPNTTLLNHTESESCDAFLKYQENVMIVPFSWLSTFFIVLGIILFLCGGVLCWKYGLQKGQTTYKFKNRSQDDTMLVRFHPHNEENAVTVIQREKEGPNANLTNIDSESDEFVAYEEIDQHLQPRPSTEESNKTPVRRKQTMKSGLPSAQEHSGYLCVKENFARQLSSTGDSDSRSSEKSKDGQNEEQLYTSEEKSLYESIRGGRGIHEHHYMDLQRTISS